jgi:hypothetical protein
LLSVISSRPRNYEIPEDHEDPPEDQGAQDTYCFLSFRSQTHPYTPLPPLPLTASFWQERPHEDGLFKRRVHNLIEEILPLKKKGSEFHSAVDAGAGNSEPTR